jgi:hypothetical protein
VRPWLRYVHVDPNLTQRTSRHEHAEWHGLILPVDHEWWLTHYSRNGWNCRCYVVSVSERDLGRYGWRVSEEAPDDVTVIRWVRGVPVRRRPASIRGLPSMSGSRGSGCRHRGVANPLGSFGPEWLNSLLRR